MTEAEIGGELIMLKKQIGRTSLLTEEQSRIQMYTLMQILYQDKYRAKLPIAGLNELNANILKTKRIIKGEEKTSNYEGISSKVSQTSNIVARLASNPPPPVRS